MHVPLKLVDEIGESKTVQYNGNRLSAKKILASVGYVMHQCALSDGDGVRLSSEVLRTVFGTNYNRLFDWANTNGYIKKSKKYASDRCMTYSIPGWAWTDEQVFVEDPRVDMIPQDRVEWVEHGLNSLTIDEEGAKSWLAANTTGAKLWYNLSAVDDIVSKRNYYVNDKQGRLYTNYTVLKKHIRRYCRLDGEEIVEVDIKNCQPILASVLAKKDGVSPDEKYMDDILSGDFYSTLSPNVDRKQAKKNAFVVMFGDNRRETFASRSFMENYPVMYKWMVEKKRYSDYRNFSKSLQRLESSLMYGRVVKNLYDGTYPMLTVHDSVHVPKHKAAEARTVVRDAIASILDRRGEDVLTATVLA